MIIKGSNPSGMKVWLIAPGKPPRPAEVMAELWECRRDMERRRGASVVAIRSTGTTGATPFRKRGSPHHGGAAPCGARVDRGSRGRARLRSSAAGSMVDCSPSYFPSGSIRPLALSAATLSLPLRGLCLVSYSLLGPCSLRPQPYLAPAALPTF